ncbi:uncharacterized protein LOC127797296 isoform X1 [Diospyros lotus]|uniref:uncharacterized protein LOC127797296 isoform X1 n=1 Tax=Diospyros lotus TaxID=55363 RepID=UPI0022512716|nr:uncharacterized protein LOC127797296 isoform X1 [Diospyros lotus]
MTSSSCDLTTGPKPSPLGGCHPRSLPEAAPCTGPQAPAPLPALIGPLSPRVGSDTTCNIPHRAIERTGTTYPDGPTRTSQGGHPSLDYPRSSTLNLGVLCQHSAQKGKLFRSFLSLEQDVTGGIRADPWRKRSDEGGEWRRGLRACTRSGFWQASRMAAPNGRRSGTSCKVA